MFHFVVITESSHAEEEDVKSDLPMVSLTCHYSEVCLSLLGEDGLQAAGTPGSL